VSAIEQIAQVERRGRATRMFADPVRERGDVAVVEELEDLPRLRRLYVELRAIERRERFVLVRGGRTR
jgi:hypothetical protein